MAKQKLTKDQKESLRKELREGLTSGAQRSEMLDTLSRKYGITAESVRWHLNRLDHIDKGPSKRKGRSRRTSRGVGAPRARRGRRPRKTAAAGAAGKPTSRGAQSPRLRDLIQQLSVRTLRRALHAKRLLPQLEASTRRERQLAQRDRQIRRLLRKARLQRRKLERRIRRLTRAR